MKRLIEESLDPGSPEGRLAALVRATPTVERAPFATERMFVCLTSATARGRRLPWAATAMALGIGISAVAAAAVRHFEVLAPSPPASVSFVVPETPSLPPAPASTAVPPAMAEKVDRSVAAEASSPSPKLKPRTRSNEARPFASGEDPAPLLEAIRTLRSEGDPARAGAMLAEYLRAYPRSPLSEDALALSIEAAVARHDPRWSAELARRYLAQFPSGRYRTFASRAAQTSAPTD